MKQRNAKQNNLTEPITDNDICKVYPRYIIPDKLNAHYILNNELRKPGGLSWYNLSTTDTTVGDSRCDTFIFSFVDGEHMRVQYNRPVNYWAIIDIDTLEFKGIPYMYVNNANNKHYAIDCFDGLFDSFFHRCDHSGFPIRSDSLCLLQAVKHIRLTNPPLKVLSMNEMFRNLPKLETIDMRGWEIPPLCLSDPNFHLFVNCPRLREIRIDDPNVSNEDIRRWLAFNFGNLNNRSPITCDTIAAYNAGKYVFDKELTECKTRKDYDSCFDRTQASYGKPIMDMNEAANCYRCYCWCDEEHMVGGYSLTERKNGGVYGIPYYDSSTCRLNNPMGDETINELAKRRHNIKDVYRTRWWGVPPTHKDLSLSMNQWVDNRMRRCDNGKKNANERVK